MWKCKYYSQIPYDNLIGSQDCCKVLNFVAFVNVFLTLGLLLEKIKNNRIRALQ